MLHIETYNIIVEDIITLNNCIINNQAIFSNIDISGDRTWRPLIGVTPISHRELRQVEIYCYGEDQRLQNLQRDLENGIRDLLTNSLRLIERTDESYSNPYYWYRLHEFGGQLMCGLAELQSSNQENSVFEQLFTQFTQNVPEL